jgi:hypothetical protein
MTACFPFTDSARAPWMTGDRNHEWTPVLHEFRLAPGRLKGKPLLLFPGDLNHRRYENIITSKLSLLRRRNGRRCSIHSWNFSGFPLFRSFTATLVVQLERKRDHRNAQRGNAVRLAMPAMRCNHGLSNRPAVKNGPVSNVCFAFAFGSHLRHSWNTG